LPLSCDDLLVVLGDKVDLHDDNYVIPIQPLKNYHTLCVLESNTSAKNRHVIYNVGDVDELKFMFSLNTMGYFEFDVLCNLNYLEEKLYAYADLPWLSRHTCYHIFGKYNNRGQYMVQLYNCTNLNCPFPMQNCDQVDNYKINNIVMAYSSSVALQSQVESKERENMFLISTNVLQDSIDNDLVPFCQGEDMLQTKICGPILSPNILHYHYLGNLVCFCNVQDQLQATSALRKAFHQEGEDDEDMATIHMTMLRESHGGQVDQQGHPNGEGGRELIRFESPRWRLKSISSLPRNPEAVCSKMDAKDTTRLHFL